MNKRIKENYYKNIKSKYILQRIFAYLTENKSLKIIKYNKNIQKKFEKDINDYKNYKKIIIELTPINKEEIKNSNNEKENSDKNYFIKYIEKEKQYYHIYFNNENEEKNRNYFTKDENVTKIKIIIDEHVTSFITLFHKCYCIEKINFIKFNRKDINNMSCMFYLCSSLKELNLNNFNTNNVTNMANMFWGCSSLKELNLSNFNTNNVTDMYGMFSYCSSLKKLNLNNFNTNKVTDMCLMFNNCVSLKELNLDNFNTNNVENMSCMFSGCSSLKELNLNNFIINDGIYIGHMFANCSDELKNKIRKLNLNLKEEAF